MTTDMFLWFAGGLIAGVVIGCGYTYSYLRQTYIIPLEGANECMKKALGWRKLTIHEVELVARRGALREVTQVHRPQHDQ